MCTILFLQVDRLCKSLNAVGLKQGDRLGVWMPNYALYVSMIIAAARLGLILVLLVVNYVYRMIM